jgi:hypothetical protein
MCPLPATTTEPLSTRQNMEADAFVQPKRMLALSQCFSGTSVSSSKLQLAAKLSRKSVCIGSA